MQRGGVHLRQVQQRFSLLQQLGGTALIGALREDGLKPLEKEAVPRPTRVTVIAAIQGGTALDQEHGQRKEQVKLLQAGLRQGELAILAQTAAGVHAVSQQQPGDFQAEAADLSSVLHAGIQSLFYQKHQRWFHGFPINCCSSNVSTFKENLSESFSEQFQ